MGEGIIRAADGRALQLRAERKDGWTRAKRNAFLDHLAATANVERSCAAVGRDPSGVFKLRRRDPDFAEQWDRALDTSRARLHGMLIERSMGGPAAGAQEEAPPEDDPPPPDPRSMDSRLAITVLKLHLETPSEKRWGGGARPRRATRESTDEAIVRKLRALRKRLERR